MFLGIDVDAGLVYESAGTSPDRPVYPTPTISQAQLIEKPEDWGAVAGSLRGNPHTWMFREDSFDPVTRTRRGRLYQSMQGATHQQVRVRPHPNEHLTGVASLDGRTSRSLYVYAACASLFELPNKGDGLKLALGNSKSFSPWRIVQVEVTVYEDVMLTLKALTAFGVVPEVDFEQVRPEFRKEVGHALDRAINSAFRESAESVVDQCRNALVMVLSRWLVQEGAPSKTLAMDLGALAGAMEAAGRSCSSAVARVVAKLHSRGKMNEVNSLRPVSEDDAELAIQILGFALREVGWAK